MNMMMPISNRLFTSAISVVAPGRKSRSSPGRDAVIEVDAIESTKRHSSGQGASSPRSQIVAWAGAIRWGNFLRR